MLNHFPLLQSQDSTRLLLFALSFISNVCEGHRNTIRQNILCIEVPLRKSELFELFCPHARLFSNCGNEKQTSNVLQIYLILFEK